MILADFLTFISVRKLSPAERDLNDYFLNSLEDGTKLVPTILDVIGKKLILWLRTATRPFKYERLIENMHSWLIEI